MVLVLRLYRFQRSFAFVLVTYAKLQVHLIFKSFINLAKYCFLETLLVYQCLPIKQFNILLLISVCTDSGAAINLGESGDGEGHQ